MASEVLTDISNYIWDVKYRYRDGDVIYDHTIEDTWRRVANALASVEPHDKNMWADNFYQILENFHFLPGGRILAGAGTNRKVTLFNCFVMGLVEDSMDGIFNALKEGALTMQQGGGIGYDFSTLRPRGMPARKVGSIASGPVSFMRIWDSMCATLLSTGARRGAMMATLRCDHPDIETFITAKKDARELRHFNLSVLVTDAFMAAVDNDNDWPLIFPTSRPAGKNKKIIERVWSGSTSSVPCEVVRSIRARELWEKIMRATYDYAEPGVLFIDTINRQNNLWYREQISATNPCGEIPLPPYGACDLGSINLTKFVKKPFTAQAYLDITGIQHTVETAIRLLDNVISVSQYPLKEQQRQAQQCRRIGLGVTGLADALIMLGLRYDSEPALRQAESIMKTLCHGAYLSSMKLAQEKGPFPFFDREKFLQGPFIQSLPAEIQNGIRKTGLRNSHLTAIAPAGTISLLAGNISSGVEPVFDFNSRRKIREKNGLYQEYELSDYALQHWRQCFKDELVPPQFIDARTLPPMAHLNMEAVIQPYVDNAISKTINIPEDFPFSSFQSLYEDAYKLGLKGCTTFRDNPVTGSILASTTTLAEQAPHCCNIEREAD